MVRCPICGKEFEAEPLKSWKFGFYDVKRYKCEACNRGFNLYISEKATFTIPKAKEEV